MTNDSKKKLLVIAILFTILLSSGIYAALLPNVHAAEASVQEKALSILSNVIGLDLAKYTISTKEYPQDAYASYLGVIPQENVAYDLTADGSKLKMLYTFANGNLQMIHVLENEGVPSLTEQASSANVLEMAKGFLSNYQTYTSNPLFGELKATLDSVDSCKNLTKTLGNKILEVTLSNGFASFKWYYTSNGATAPFSKFIALVFKDGFLSGFVDNWQFYNVGSTSINLSQEEAIILALETARAHAYSLKLETYGFEAKNINETNIRWASLIFDSSLNANRTRSEDVLALYPVWRVGIALDKWYGYMYGIEVDIWADNGEVRYIQEAWSTMPPPEGVLTANMSTVGELTSQTSDENPTTMSNSQTSVVDEAESNIMMWITRPTIVAAVMGIALVLVITKKKSHSYNLLKPRSLKTGGILLGVLILSMIVLTPIAAVSAATKTAVIWGSESTGANDPNFPPNYNWRKSLDERSQQQVTASILRQYFQYGGGYTAYNNQGSNGATSNKDDVLSAIQTYTDASSRVAFVDFDHGVGNYINGEFHFMFEDQTGTGIGTWESHWWDISKGVYDRDIYWRTWYGKTLFAFINTCHSASLVIPGTSTPWQGYGTQGAKGIPYAFTHGRTVVDREQTPGFNIESHMSDDAYFYPDDGSQVFIGFVGGSASLTQRIPYDSGPYYHSWVDRFFYYALYYSDMSVNHALDHASFELWGMYFANPYVPLRDFTAYWWNGVPSETGPGSMAVYGNGRLRLKSFGDDFNDGNYNGWTVTMGSWSASTGKLRSQQQNSLIRTNQQFTTDRHVRVQAKTLTAGPGNGDVAWVMAKYVDLNNMVCGSLHKNGLVQLAIVKNGQTLTWSGSSPFNPLNTNTIEVNIVGTKAWVWVNGNLKLTVTHEWLDDFSGYTALYSHSSTAEFDDITVLTQTYQTTYHKLIISSGPGGSTSPSPGTYRYAEGTPVTVTANPQGGYVFDQWLLDGQPAGSNPTKIVTMNQFHTLQANFRPALYYDLTISAGSGGSTTPPPGTYEDIIEGTPVTVTANPNSGYVFDHWELDYQPAGSNPTIIVTMNSNHNLQAYFVSAPSYYFVSSIDSYDGPVYSPENLVGWQNDGQFAAIEGYGPYYYYGWISGAMNAPATGHIYVYGGGYGPLYVYVSSDGWNWNYVSAPYVTSGSPYWIDCGTYLSPFNYILLTAEDPYDFSYIEIDSVKVEPPVYYTLTISSGNGGTTTPSPGAYQYAQGTPVAVTANPDGGYVLDYWLLDGQNAGTQNPITVTMNGDHTLQANFREGTATHWLTVDAYDEWYYNELYPNVYVDSVWVGTAPVSVQVTDGWHYIEVDDWVWNEYYWCYDYFSYFSGDFGYLYNNPIYVNVNGDKSATAWYTSY